HRLLRNVGGRAPFFTMGLRARVCLDAYILEVAYSSAGVALRRAHDPRRAHAPADPRPAARVAALGRRARRAARGDPAAHPQAPARPARRRPRPRPPGRPAPRLPAAARAPGRARRVAGAVPAPVGGPARRARGAPGREPRSSREEPQMTATLDIGNGRSTLRFDRLLAHSRDRVWIAVTDPGELVQWFPTAVVYEP